MHITHTAERLKNYWLLDQDNEDQEQTGTENIQFDDINFILCGVFCLIAVLALIIFSIAALVRQDVAYAFTLFGFALANITGLSAIWISGEDWLAKHFTTALMAILCIYLFYTGGTNNTGPVILLIFPTVALFLQGNKVGSYSVLSLLLIVLGIYIFAPFSFDNRMYSPTFISRVLVVFVVVASLSYAFDFFRDKSEESFVSSQLALEHGNIEDPDTGLANRALMQRLLEIETNRCKQYQRPGCLIHIDLHIELAEQFKFLGDGHKHVNKNIVRIFEKVLRITDIPGHWSQNQLRIILPETSYEEACKLAAKIYAVFKNYNKLFDDQTVAVKATISTKEITS